jgi:phosphopantothenoylcysteine decarboxylase/phosphopantothenate--cysteine ligase
MSILTDKRLLLGVTGSIAAYKAVELASKLTQAGTQVDVILTSAAEKFVSALTFQSVTKRPAFTDADLWGGGAHVPSQRARVLHIELGRQADLLAIAPCTANTLAKLAYGSADNLLTITALAASCPLLIAPAMDGGMFQHPAVQENLRIITKRGAYLAGPAQGYLASGLSGLGRMLEPLELLGHIRCVLGKDGPLAGKRIVVTAGGTHEPIDTVRSITNRSSGKQGYALAQAAVDNGGQVTLISTPTCLTPPVGAQRIEVSSVDEMLEAVLAESAGADALLMAAAPADFRPVKATGEKLKRRDGVPRIELEFAPDVLKMVSEKLSEDKRPLILVGFAAESRDLLENAAEKLKSKNLDIIAANDISATDAGFGTENNRLTLLYRDGRQEPLPLMSKLEAAEAIMARVVEMLGHGNK